MATVKFDFRGKKALVTGGSRGIGRDIVQALADSNIDKIYVVGRDHKSLDKVKADLVIVETIRADLADWEETKTALEHLEPVDYLINNAGSAIGESFFDATQESFDKLFNLNVRGVICVSQVVCKKMMKKGGVVVNISSQSSMKALPNHLCYGASKAALDFVSRQMAFELAPKIRVVAVNPTVCIPTDLSSQFWYGEKAEAMQAQIPLKRFAELKEVTQVVLFLLTEGAGMVDGLCLPICGGFTNA